MFSGRRERAHWKKWVSLLKSMCLIFIMFRSFVGSFCFVAEVTKRFLECVRECFGVWDKT